ncbi:MAG TPA: RagB/SusD family nutrient uptake outer membrane protein, partial [Sphingobacteriaceae bacterium]
MKTRIIAILFILISTGCMKDVLDVKPLDRISDEDVFKSEPLAVVYLAALYNNIPIGFPGQVSQAHMTDEASVPYSSPGPVSGYGNYTLALNTGMYSWIRKANYFLERINTSTLTEDQKKKLSAECRFIRAYYYFDLVKKYGGMPIITKTQDINEGIDKLQVSRNTEDETYEFILKELNDAITDLPDTRDAANANRATKSTALALKSRAMLYAGSIAKYGTVQLNGLVGIPSQKAVTYYTESFNASKAIIDGGKFGLYDK